MTAVRRTAQAGLLLTCAAVGAAACGGGESPVGAASPRSTAPNGATCTAAATEPGFRLLFDGTEASLAGWSMAGPGAFRLEDCALRTEGGLGLLWHEAGLPASYVLRVDWRAEGDDNSGVFVGFPDPGGDPWVAVRQGLEVQVDGVDEAGWTTGAVYELVAPDVAARDAALRPPGQWNTFEITVDGDRVSVDLNGARVSEADDVDAARLHAPGHVGLQNHGVDDEVFFRSVRVRDASAATDS